MMTEQWFRMRKVLSFPMMSTAEPDNGQTISRTKTGTASGGLYGACTSKDNLRSKITFELNMTLQKRRSLILLWENRTPLFALKIRKKAMSERTISRSATFYCEFANPAVE